MPSKLYIASKPALHDQLNPQHLCIVYDPDGNPNSGDELIIRGGPPTQTTGFSGFISVEIARPILLSLDGPVSGDDPPYTINDLPSVESRNFTLIEAGTAADTLWATMVDFAISLSNDEDAQAGGVYGTDFTYAPTNSNSNSTVTSVLAGAGLNVNDYLPVIGGDLTGTASPTAPRYDFNDVPGAHVLLSGGESNTFSGFGRGPATQDNVFFDTADPDGDSGYDVFYGGALNNKLASYEGDGKDAYFYIQPGPSERLTFSAIRDGSGNQIGNKIETPDGKYDELYSIEIIGNRTYDNTHAIMYQFNAGLQIRDLSATELAGLSSDFDTEFAFDTAFEVDFGGGITTQFANFGDITATEHNDVFQVSAAIGRSFDGGGGSDTVLFTEVSDGISVTASSASNLVVAKGIAGAQGTDHLYSVEAIWGSTGNDTFNGVKGGSLYYRGQDGSDDYVFDLAADTGSVLIYDNGSTGIDTLRLTNFGEDMLISKDQVEEDAVIFRKSSPTRKSSLSPFLRCATSGTSTTLSLMARLCEPTSFYIS